MKLRKVLLGVSAILGTAAGAFLLNRHIKKVTAPADVLDATCPGKLEPEEQDIHMRAPTTPIMDPYTGEIEETILPDQLAFEGMDPDGDLELDTVK